jgi:hypothetical protein
MRERERWSAPDGCCAVGRPACRKHRAAARAAVRAAVRRVRSHTTSAAPAASEERSSLRVEARSLRPLLARSEWTRAPHRPRRAWSLLSSRWWPEQVAPSSLLPLVVLPSSRWHCRSRNTLAGYRNTIIRVREGMERRGHEVSLELLYLLYLLRIRMGHRIMG